jgi:hypothetical protein
MMFLHTPADQMTSVIRKEGLLGREMPISREATKHKIPQKPTIQKSKCQTQNLKMEAAKASLLKRFWVENHGICFPSTSSICIVVILLITNIQGVSLFDARFYRMVSEHQNK